MWQSFILKVFFLDILNVFPALFVAGDLSLFNYIFVSLTIAFS